MDRGHDERSSAGRRETSSTRRRPDEMNTIDEGQRRIVQCECGKQLAGGSDQELFEAVERHLAHHHPQLLGALEPEVVVQMAEDVGPGRARGRTGA